MHRNTSMNAGMTALVALLLAAAASAQPEQWLQYRTSRESRGYQWLVLTTNAPPNITLPALNAQPYFARWITPMDPAGGRWLCLDRTRKSGPYNRLFYDSKGNGRLDGQSPVEARIDDQNASFDPVRVVFPGEDGPITYHLVFRCYQYPDKSVRLLVGSGGWYEGMVTLGIKKRRVELIDGNVNGTFNDWSANPHECDRIIVEGDKAGERFQGRLLEVEDQLFRFEAARDGAFLKVQPAEHVVFGRVRLPGTISSFAAVGENGHFVHKPVRGETTLPVGTYRVHGWTIERKDDKGAAWKLSGYGFKENASFEVTADKPSTLNIGEPIRATLGATESTNQVAFSLRFLGQFGESMDIQRENQRPRGPRLSLASLDGTHRYTNTFEFG